MSSMKRGVGYCENTDCEDYAKGVFLLNHSDTFYCPRCRQLGKVERERGRYEGNSDVFKEVRVEYNFDPINNVYREIAIVRDESLWGRNNVYTLHSPLIKTEKRALKVAEAILGSLNRYRGLLHPDDIPRTTEFILSFDDPREEFARKLRDLSKQWEQSGLREQRGEPEPRRRAGDTYSLNRDLVSAPRHR
jgi:ribosomal protein S27AE